MRIKFTQKMPEATETTDCDLFETKVYDKEIIYIL